MSLTHNNATSIILGVLTPQIIFYDSEVKGCMRCDTHACEHTVQYTTFLFHSAEHLWCYEGWSVICGNCMLQKNIFFQCGNGCNMCVGVAKMTVTSPPPTLSTTTFRPCLFLFSPFLLCFSFPLSCLSEVFLSEKSQVLCVLTNICISLHGPMPFRCWS